MQSTASLQRPQVTSVITGKPHVATVALDSINLMTRIAPSNGAGQIPKGVPLAPAMVLPWGLPITLAHNTRQIQLNIMHLVLNQVQLPVLTTVLTPVLTLALPPVLPRVPLRLPVGPVEAPLEAQPAL